MQLVTLKDQLLAHQEAKPLPLWYKRVQYCTAVHRECRPGTQETAVAPDNDYRRHLAPFDRKISNNLQQDFLKEKYPPVYTFLVCPSVFSPLSLFPPLLQVIELLCRSTQGADTNQMSSTRVLFSQGLVPPTANQVVFCSTIQQFDFSRNKMMVTNK